MARGSRGSKKMMKSLLSADMLTCVLLVVVIGLMIYTAMLYKENFTDVQTENGKAKLVMYYADWCGHCKRAKPEMEKLEEKLKEQNNKVNGKEVEVVYVDGDKEEELLKKEDVQGFPTIRLYRLSDMIEYQGERAVNALMGFLEENL